MMMRPPFFMCFSAAWVAASAPRTLMSITRSISSSVVVSKVFGIAVPALLTSTSSRPKVATVFSTAPLTASASAASAWIAIAFPPSRSIAFTTAEAALASFAYVMATLAPSAARRFAIAAPMPREPPVTSAIFPSSFLDIVFLLFRLISLSANPVAYVRRAVEERDPLCFASPEEANNLDIDQVHFLQIDYDLRSALPNLLLQFSQMFRLHSPNESNRRAGSFGISFDLQGHVRPVGRFTSEWIAIPAPFVII